MEILVFLNATLYSLYALKTWHKTRLLTIEMLLVLLYTLTAIMCFVFACRSPKTYPNVDLLPFLYLFFTLLIFLLPVSRMSNTTHSIVVKNEAIFNYFAFVYILLAIFDCVTSFAHIEELVRAGMWNELRDQTYTDAESVLLYDNQHQRIAKNLLGYFKPLILPLTLFQLTKPKVNKLLLVGLILSIVVPSFIAAAADASRGMIVNVIVQLTISYLIFRPYIPQQRKKYIYYGGIVIAVFFALYLISVTVSRFGNEEAGDSLYFYFGHSMLAFNDGVFGEMKYYGWGRKFFDYFFDLFGGDSSFDSTKAGCTCGGAFVTFIGSLYMDFGPIGTIIVGLLATKLLMPFFKKRDLLLSDTVIIIYYTSTIANGIFVSPRGRALSWVMVFLVYLITKKIEK